jgi:hypothetical protein
MSGNLKSRNSEWGFTAFNKTLTINIAYEFTFKNMANSFIMVSIIANFHYN